MSDTSFTTHGDEPVEARIVSWVLGEASAFEAAELERLCEERPELMVFKRRMAALNGLLAEAENPRFGETWKLPPVKRIGLVKILDPTSYEIDHTEVRVHRSAMRTFLAIAACLILTAIVLGLSAPMVLRQRKKADVTEARSRKMQKELAAFEAESMQPLRTELPPELIEGTPKPIILPNLEAPADGPAGSETWESRDGAAFAKASAKPRVVPQPAARPSEPAKSMAKVIAANGAAATGVPVPDVDVTAPSLDFGNADEFGAGFDDGGAGGAGGAGLAAERSAPAQAGAQTAETEPLPQAALTVREEETKSDSATLPFKSESVMPAEELEKFITAGKRSGDFPIEKSNIDGILHGDVQGAGEIASNAEKQPEEAGAAPVIEVMPALGRLFSRDKKKDLSLDSDRYDSSESLPGGGVAASESEAEPKELGRVAGASSLRSNSEPTDEDWKNSEIAGQVESLEEDKREYFFRDTNLGKDKGKAPASEISVLREFQYPAEYEPPTLPDDAAAPDSFPETPATPDSFLEQAEGVKASAAATPEPPKVDLTKLMEEIPAAEDPYSTFSLNISDASFQVAQAALAKGELPDPAGIKVEQFYNAVDYGDPAPSANEPVAVNIEQSAHPVIPGRNLVRIALKTAAAGRSASQPLRLTLLVDQSGSMVREDRRVAMDKALAGLSELLTKNDLVTVIGFSRTPRLLADGMTGDKAGKLADLVNQSASEGGTNLEEAIKLGEQMAGRQKLAGAQNRIVLFTDGAANLGNADPARLAEKVKQLRQKGIAFDIAGIAADDLNDGLLGELARNGNGRYYVVGKGADGNFAKQLAGAFRPAAENVKVQVRFNPERVARYKLIGFEKDRLKTEDFRNDKVDAAELAAEEAGVAIYQVEPLPEGNGELGEVSVRFRDTAAGQMVERTWTIPHDANAPVLDRATPSMQLAVLSMLAGEKLKGGPLAAAIDFKQLIESTANVKQFYGNTGRVGEMLRVVDSLK